MQISPAVQATPTGAPLPMAATTTAPAPTGALDAIGAITTIHLVLIAILALLALAVIAYGMAQRRRHRAAEREEQARVESLGGAPAIAQVEPAPAAVSEQEQRPAAALRPAAVDLPRGDPIAAPEPVVPATPQASLTRIKGLGPKVQARLTELGITRVDQLAALTDDEADALDAQLGAFRGRIARDRWVEQARFLAAGDVRGFEAVFGRL